MSTLRLENISKSFGKLIALSNINLEIGEGKFFVVLGPSGCGKSTLLNIIAGLEEPTLGKVYLGNKDITELPPNKRNIAMVFQNYALYPHLNAYENIAFGLRIRKEKDDRIRDKVEGVSGILNIQDKLKKYPRELSGGERQRVATGRAIVREPILFLFDEPLSNLDAQLRIELRSEFIKLHRQLKRTIIYVTHDQVEAMVLGEEIVVLKDGSIQQISPPKELYYNPQNLFVAKFIGTPPINVIRLRVTKSNDKLKLTKDNFALDIPENFVRQLENYINKDIFFCFRPSTASLNETGCLKGEIVFTETLGEENYAHVRIHPEVEIKVKISENANLNPQDVVSVAIDSKKIYLFNGNEIRICSTAPS